MIVKNYPARKAAMASVSLPLLLLVSSILMLPFVLIGSIGITAGVIVTILAEVLVIWLALSYTDQLSNWREALYLKNFKWSNVLMGVTVGAGLWLLLQILATLLSGPMGQVESSETSTSLGDLGGIQKYLILLFVVPFVVPFVEEVFFRGYVLGFFRNMDGNWSKKTALVIGIVVSTVFFAIAHIQGFSTFSDWFLIVWISIVALVNAVLVIKTDSIYTSYASHLTYNLITAIMTLIAASAM